VRRLNAQSPSELRWRLRVKSRHIYGFDNMMDLKHTISLMDGRRYRSADPPLMLTRTRSWRTATEGPLSHSFPSSKNLLLARRV